MPDLLKTTAVLAFIVFMLRRKVSMAAVMPLGALLLGIIYLTPPRLFLDAVKVAIFSPKSMEMTATLMLTMVMEHILRTTGMLRQMVASLSAALKDRRVVMAALPAMIGMLPSPGGAVFSAPMVNEAAGEATIRPEQKALINYWYRHIWEYVSPLYPGIILVAGISGLTTRTLFIANLPFAISVVGWGAVFCFRGIEKQPPVLAQPERLRQLLVFMATSSPILLSLLLVIILGISPVIALGLSVLGLYLAQHYTATMILKNLRESVSGKALFLVMGIMIFQEVLRVTGALDGISYFFAAKTLPIYLILILIPFFAGIMTGLTVGFVGITFPLLMPLMGGAHPSPGLVALAFAAGFAGVMLSPVHLCYLLTCEYFNVDIALVYHRLLIPSAFVLAAAIVPLYFF